MEQKFLIIIAFITLYGVLLLRRKQMMFYILALYQQASAMFSLAIIEGGAYITEQRRFGFENGSFYIYLVFSLTTLVLFYKWSKKINLWLPAQDNRRLFFGATFAFCALLILAIWKAGPGYNRFSLYVGGTEFDRLLAYATALYEAVYIYAVLKEKNNASRFAYLVCYIGVIVLKAEEFGGYFMAVYVYYWGYVIQQTSGGSARGRSYHWKTRIVFLSVFCATIGAVYYKYTQIPDIRFLFRIINQAHTFWGAINVLDFAGPTFDFKRVLVEFFSFETAHLREDYGLGQLEYAIAGEVARQYHEVGVRFAIGYPSILLFHFGYLLAYLLHIPLIGMYVWIFRLQMDMLRNWGIIIFILFSKFSEPFVDLFLSGEYDRINIKLILPILVTLLWVKLWKMLHSPSIHMKFAENESSKSTRT